MRKIPERFFMKILIVALFLASAPAFADPLLDCTNPATGARFTVMEEHTLAKFYISPELMGILQQQGGHVVHSGFGEINYGA